MLAISLHAVRDELRNELVPLNRKYPIAELLQACRDYPGASNARRITFEYVMLKGVNDSLDDAKLLVKLLKGIPAKINLIPFNPWPGTRLRMLGLGADREILRIYLQRRLFLAGAHAARPRHPRRLRPVEIGDRKIVRARAPGAARHGDDGLSDWMQSVIHVRHCAGATATKQSIARRPRRYGLLALTLAMTVMVCMALIGRLFVILFAFLAACLVAGMIVVGAVLYPEFTDLGNGADRSERAQYRARLRLHLHLRLCAAAGADRGADHRSLLYPERAGLCGRRRGGRRGLLSRPDPVRSRRRCSSTASCAVISKS